MLSLCVYCWLWFLACSSEAPIVWLLTPPILMHLAGGLDHPTTEPVQNAFYTKIIVFSSFQNIFGGAPGPHRHDSTGGETTSYAVDRFQKVDVQTAGMQMDESPQDRITKKPKVQKYDSKKRRRRRLRRLVRNRFRTANSSCA